MMLRGWIKASLRAGAIAPAFACLALAQITPDSSAVTHPKTESVGVTMPTAEWFPHSWDASTYVLRVTQFGIMPPLNGGVAFVGDSLTDWMRWNELFPEVRSRNFGIAGDTSVGLKARINQVIAAKPATVFLQIGTNDVEFGKLSAEAVAANIGDCIDALKQGVPDVTIYVEGLLPRQPQYDDKVRNLNTAIKAVAEAHGLTFIDLYPHFVAGGRLDPKLTPDDLHLSGEGYLRWRDIIRPYIGNK